MAISKTKRELIASIVNNKANLEHIAQTGNINGSLLIEIEKVMQNYADQESKAFANWLSNTVIAGRTMDKLFKDYKTEIGD